MRKTKQTKFLDRCLLFVGAFLFAFVITMVITFWRFQMVPDTLITAVLGTGGAELVVTGIIAISKNITNRGKDDAGVHIDGITADIDSNEPYS